MEDVYTIKVKTKPDTRNLYPSERRYSASTVSGLAWVHIALGATSFLLACLALVNNNTDIEILNLNNTEQKTVNRSDFAAKLDFESNSTESDGVFDGSFNNVTEDIELNGMRSDNSYLLVLAPALLTIFALAAGVASIMASVRWYIDRNITWLFIMSIFSTAFAAVSFITVLVYLVTVEEVTESHDYTDKDFIVVKYSDVIDRNGSHVVIKTGTTTGSGASQPYAKKVLSINVLIASVLEFLWSLLSMKISYKGMRSNYKDDNERRGNCISVVTTIKGNNTKKLPRNGKLLKKPDLIQHYPSADLKKFFLAQSDSGFYLKNQNGKAKNTETSSEFYKERMMNFLNRCASLEGMSNTDLRTPSVQSASAETVLEPIPEVVTAEIYADKQGDRDSTATPVSWGDSPEHTVYNQNTLNLEKIFSFSKRNMLDTDKNIPEEGEKQASDKDRSGEPKSEIAED